MNLGTFPFPPVNASLNGASAVLLVAALVCIKTRRIKAHVAFVVAALLSSSVFLTFYLLFHYYRVKHGIAVTNYPASNPLKPLYATILITHTILAVAILPLIVATLIQAMSRRWSKHRSIAWWTFPLWLYVSITGVVIYVMLSASGAYKTMPPPSAAKTTNVASAM
jgi:putative membrane protein